MYITAFKCQSEVFLATAHYVPVIGANVGYDAWRTSNDSGLSMAMGLFNMFTL